MLSNLGLRTKLLLLAFSGILCAILVGGIALFKMGQIVDAEASLAEDALPSLVLISKLNDQVNNIREKQLNATIAVTPAVIDAEEKDMNGFVDSIPPLLGDYQKRIDNDAERSLFDSLNSRYNAYLALARQTLKDVRTDDAEKLAAAQKTARVESGKAFDELGNALDALTDFNLKAVAETHAHSQSVAHSAWVVVISIFCLAVLAMVAIALWLTRAILGQLGGEPEVAAQAVDAMAQGDLAGKISLSSGDSTSLMAKLKQMQGSIAGVVQGVRVNAESVSTASAEIAQGNEDLSARTESQASALEETAASMEQLSSTVRQNADNARQANQLAMSASTVASQGGDVVNQVVETMKGINDSSKKIADIISVIDGIAFQTNILALNAAVEAARAGEQGRGFAVVASEVRSLAGRSAEAAKEIKNLINASVERVAQGTTLVDQAGTTMTEVVSSIRRVTDIMGEISAASSEQSAGVAQVGEAVTQMDHATQQNAALVEEMAAAASSLRNQAQELVQSVAVFKLELAPRTAAPVLAPVAAVRAKPLAAPPKAAPAKNPVALDATKTADKPLVATADDDWAAF